MDAGAAEAQFDLDDYGTKSELTSAINGLPVISTTGNSISNAMRTLRSEVLSSGYRRYDGYVSKVALTFADDRARDSNELEAAFQVVCHLNRTR